MVERLRPRITAISSSVFPFSTNNFVCSLGVIFLSGAAARAPPQNRLSTSKICPPYNSALRSPMPLICRSLEIELGLVRQTSLSVASVITMKAETFCSLAVSLLHSRKYSRKPGSTPDRSCVRAACGQGAGLSDERAPEVGAGAVSRDLERFRLWDGSSTGADNQAGS